LVHGPYITAPKGRYTIKWQVNVRREVMDTDLQPALRLDITIENGKRTLIEKDFSLAEIRASSGSAQRDFEVSPDDVKNLELRTLSLGVAYFLIGMKRYVVNEAN
jgi:hypothetical protein